MDKNNRTMGTPRRQIHNRRNQTNLGKGCYEAQTYQVANRKAKHGRLYNYEKEEGTRITSINTSGPQTYF
eukprot:6232097-Heterocapsa_arctica.AAC.1